MKKPTAVLACLLLIATGYKLVENASAPSAVFDQQNALHAATVPNWNYNGQMSLDILLDQAKRIGKDTIFVEIRDTVVVNNTKYVRVPAPERTTDTLYIPMTDLPEIEVTPVKNQSQGDREEQTPDEIRDGPVIVLTVDGKTVYASENDNSSGSNPQDTMSVPDEPLKL